jgi:hypothetical protein
MMEPVTREKTERLYRRLAELTRADQLKWSRVSRAQASAFVPGDGVARNAYTAEYEGAEFLVLEYASRNYDGERDEHYFTEQELVSTMVEGTRAYDFVYAAGLSDLVEAIKLQVNGVPQLVDRILSSASA